ncbi:hypothetical protein RB195_016273 [Necator americanus]|uniref:Uncharacterized protein n=1 Tax=Necator americanus TaxID=51031 RepID=A0ABR1E8D3_NECAM
MRSLEWRFAQLCDPCNQQSYRDATIPAEIPIYVPRSFRPWLDAVELILYANQTVYYTSQPFQLKSFVVFLSSFDI